MSNDFGEGYHGVYEYVSSKDGASAVFMGQIGLYIGQIQRGIGQTQRGTGRVSRGIGRVPSCIGRIWGSIGQIPGCSGGDEEVLDGNKVELVQYLFVSVQ